MNEVDLDDSSQPTAPGRVVLLAGPSGCGKSRLARASGLPVLCLDEFYKDGGDPTCPRDEHLGIVDWDDPGAWDADAAMAAIEGICRDGTCDVPRYDISQDRAVATTAFSRGESPVFVAEGIFVAEVVERCRDSGLLADAIVITRPPWKNFARRLVRDLSERRKPPMTLVRRGRALMAAESGLVDELVQAGCRPLDAGDAARTLAEHARHASPANRSA